MSDLTLLTPTALGAIEMPNRVVMAPLTRNRAIDRVPGDLQVEYYRQRAGAGLVITEATSVSPQGVGYEATPGIWSDEQVAGWRRVTDAVHEQGGRIVCQLWHVGRVSHESFFTDDDGPVAPSPVNAGAQTFVDGAMVATADPRALTVEEIPGVVDQFRHATRQARAAGFDGVEVHGANGYLLEQFLASGSNERDDHYGGSPDNRARFLAEVVDAVVEGWSADRVGLRLSLGNGTFGATEDEPLPVLRAVAEAIASHGLAYVHVIEAFARTPEGTRYEDDERTALLRAHAGAPVIVNGGFDRAHGEAALTEGRATAVVYGKPFISNPDLVERFRVGAELASWDEATFYGGDAEGYTDYPTLAEQGARSDAA